MNADSSPGGQGRLPPCSLQGEDPTRSEMGAAASFGSGAGAWTSLIGAGNRWARETRFRPDQAMDASIGAPSRWSDSYQQ